MTRITERVADMSGKSKRGQLRIGGIPATRMAYEALALYTDPTKALMSIERKTPTIAAKEIVITDGLQNSFRNRTFARLRLLSTAFTIQNAKMRRMGWMKNGGYATRRPK